MPRNILPRLPRRFPLRFPKNNGKLGKIGGNGGKQGEMGVMGGGLEERGGKWGNNGGPMASWSSCMLLLARPPKLAVTESPIFQWAASTALV